MLASLQTEQRFLTEVKQLQCACGQHAVCQLLDMLRLFQAEARVNAEMRARILADGQGTVTPTSKIR
jgi:hypothetical protein